LIVRWLVLALLVGCWRDAPPPRDPEPPDPPKHYMWRPPVVPHDKLSDALEQLRDFGSRMCQCSDTACAHQVQADLMEWEEHVSQDPELRDVKPTDEQQQQATEAVKQVMDCLTRIMAGPVMTAPPTPSP
jgi:hypothetical protein